MDRRSFLKATGACAATTAAATAATSAASQASPSSNDQAATGSVKQNSGDIRVFDVLMPWPDTLSGPFDQLRRFANLVNNASADRIQIAPRSTQAPENASSQSTKTANKLRFGPTLTLTPAVATNAFFSGLPHAAGMNANQIGDWLKSGGGNEIWDTACEPHGIKPLLTGHLGETPGLWSKFPIRSLSQLNGKNIAATSVSADILRAFGAHPIDMNPREIAKALETGQIDIAESGSFHTAMSLGLHEAASYVSKGAYNPAGATLALAWPLDQWHALAPADRTLLTTCANDAYTTTVAENKLLEKTLEAVIQKAHGIQLTVLDPQANRDWFQVNETLQAHASGGAQDHQAIATSYAAFSSLTA